MMETATLTSPPRTLMVQPIQKSLSLPSYAKAGGEGIDHKIIFAALEQREKIRRKSKIFKDKEKCGTTRQNYFCLPLPSTNKCRETSFSSDTSCSSLEFQKPKSRASPVKIKNNDCDRNPIDNGFVEIGKNSPSPVQHANNILTKEVVIEENSKQETQPQLRVDVFRSTIGSSDSMERTERSSKSSNDSLSRKERLVAIKARVEAEREKKFNKSSSDDEDVHITRHNSDGVIHRTVREVKAKSSKYDKRYRRKTQDEMAMRRALRRQHTSLYLPHTTDFDVWKPPIQRSGSSFSLQRDLEEFTKEFLSTDQRTNCNPISVINPNYFSDICNDKLRSRFVKPKIQEIESKQLESMLMASALRKEKTNSKTPNHHDSNDNFTDYKQKLKHMFFNSRDNRVERPNFRYRDEDSSRKCPSPIPRAPTPPPRSPKSIDFINKVYLQHQKTSSFLQEARSLERKKTMLNSDSPSTVNMDSIHSFQSSCLPKTAEPIDVSFLCRRSKDSNSRRRTLCNFPQVDEIVVGQRPRTPTNSYRSKFPPQNFPPRSPDLSHKICDPNRRTKGYASGSDISAPKLQSDVPGKKWERLELDSEKKFNSLENRSKANMSMWLKDRWPPRQNSPCLCLDPNHCLCSKDEGQYFKVDKKYIDMFQIGAVENSKTNLKIGENNKTSKSMPTSKTPPIPLDRLSRSEANLSKRSPPKTPSPKLRNKEPFLPKTVTKDNEQMSLINRHIASENLNTAMEELENVYRSLRISNENLSSQVDDHPQNANDSKIYPSKPPSKSSSFLQSNSTEKSYQNFLRDPLGEKINKNTNTAELKISMANFSINDNNVRSSLKDALCIEELFSDLTQQLDFEQKQLQDSKNKKTLSTSSIQQLEFNVPVQEIPKTTDCSTNFNKCAYDFNAELETLNSHFDTKEALVAKRKQEAVDCLSTNITYLMKTSPKLSRLKPEKLIDYPSSIKILEKTRREDKLDNDTSLENPMPESTFLCQKSDDFDEIWQVRVSMNSGNAQPDSNIVSSKADRSCSPYSRLRSALRSPRADSSREPSPCPSSPGFRIKTMDGNNELEKMLTDLLCEVPQTKMNIRPSQEEVHKESSQIKTVTKDVTHHQDLQKHYLVNMENNIAPKDVVENEKKTAESFHDVRKNFSKKSMDNDSLQNNNYSSQIQRLSFIPVRCHGNHRGKYALPKYKSCDDNRGVTSQQNSSFIGNLSYPASPIQSPVRRHSLGIDDLSNDLSIHVNSNLGQRFQSLGRCANSPSASNTASITYNLTSFEKITSNRAACQDPLSNGKGNQNDKNQFLYRSSNNSSPRPFSAACSESSQSNEKVRDKSFIRKSSLNRIEFVNSAHQITGGTPYAPYFHPPEQHSTSEINSDNQDRSKPLAEKTSVGTSVKRKGNSLKLNKKGILSGRQTKQDFPGLNVRKEEGLNINAALSPKAQERSVWWRNRKAGFKKKSYSAGEQDSFTDNSDIWKQENLCFSAQEIDSNEYCFKRISKNLTFVEPKKTLQSSPQLPRNNSGKELECGELALAIHNTLTDQINACDNTSQTNSGKVLDAPNKANVSEDVSTIKLESKLKVDVDDNTVVKNESKLQRSAALFEDGSLDGDLFVCPKSPTFKVSTYPFPTDDIEPKLSEASAIIKNNEDNKVTSDCFGDNHEDITKVSSEISSLEISTDSLETNAAAKDIDATKQKNSILRRKSDDRKGIHGILKNAGDDKLSWQPPSILKHRESSEEKDNWSQSDLHSILKKSASEDESCNGNSDIRPILKNTSTDDESSGLSSRPKPILKKRTSFSEECSYACFLSGELKPILKKKTINESSDDQPKPILKLRRKSEEATGSISEFPLGTRPRAYSADRGVRMCNEKKSLDDDLT